MLIPGTGGSTRAELIRVLFDPRANDELGDSGESLLQKFCAMSRVIAGRTANCLLITNHIYVDQRYVSCD